MQHIGETALYFSYVIYIHYFVVDSGKNDHWDRVVKNINYRRGTRAVKFFVNDLMFPVEIVQRGTIATPLVYKLP